MPQALGLHDLTISRDKRPGTLNTTAFLSASVSFSTAAVIEPENLQVDNELRDVMWLACFITMITRDRRRNRSSGG